MIWLVRIWENVGGMSHLAQHVIIPACNLKCFPSEAFQRAIDRTNWVIWVHSIAVRRKSDVWGSVSKGPCLRNIWKIFTWSQFEMLLFVTISEFIINRVQLIEFHRGQSRKSSFPSDRSTCPFWSVRCPESSFELIHKLWVIENLHIVAVAAGDSAIAFIWWVIIVCFCFW